MKTRFILYRRKLGGMFYVEDTQTRKQETLGTKDWAKAKALLNARNESVRQPQLNRQIAQAYLGGMRKRAAEGSLLFDEAEKAHPRVLDILLQLLDAARITVATGQTLDFSGFFTSNIGSAELMSLQHSNNAKLERHVLTRAQ